MIRKASSASIFPMRCRRSARVSPCKSSILTNTSSRLPLLTVVECRKKSKIRQTFGVRNLLRQFHFAFEALQTIGVAAHERPDHLQRYTAIQFDVLGFVYFAHATSGQEANHSKAIYENRTRGAYREISLAYLKRVASHRLA